MTNDPDTHMSTTECLSDNTVTDIQTSSCAMTPNDVHAVVSSSVETPVPGLQESPVDAPSSPTTPTSPSTPTRRRKRGSYKNYSEAQIKCLVNGYVCECLTITEAAKRAGINRATASRMLKKLNEDEHHRLPIKKQRGRTVPPTLDENHTNVIIRFLDKHPNTTLEEVQSELGGAFPGLAISKNALSTHIRNTCYFTVERAEELVRHDTPEIRARRKETVMGWRVTPDFDYEQNCVFIGESVFQFHILRSFGRSRKSSSSTPTTESNRPASPGVQSRRHLPVFAAVTNIGVIDISVMVTTGGTSWEHFRTYLKTVMDVLDRSALCGRYLVFDNVSMITPEIKFQVEQRGYRCAWIPPCSPFLSPVQDFFSHMASLIKRKPLEPPEQLVSRIRDAAEQIKPADIQGWIHKATTYFDRCVQGEFGL